MTRDWVRAWLFTLMAVLIAPASAWPLGVSIGGGNTDSGAAVRTAAVIVADTPGATMSVVAHAFEDGLGFQQRNHQIARENIHSEYVSGVMEYKRRYPASEHFDITSGVRGGLRGTQARIVGVAGAAGKKVEVDGGDAEPLALLYFLAWNEKPDQSISAPLLSTLIGGVLGYAFRDSGAIVPYLADGFSLGGSWHTAQRGLKLELDFTVIALPKLVNDSDKPSQAQQFDIEYNPKHVLMTTLSLVWVF